LHKNAHIYFIGIGGIGMSALARYFKLQGKTVSGYDRSESALTRQLEAEGIQVHYKEDPGQVPEDPECVVYTPAIPDTHLELQYCRERKYSLLKRSEVLGWITRQSYNICVAGTHGKTTISTLTAHILRHSGTGCNAFLGGISVNYGTNFWNHENNVCVMEADEYDRSFLKLYPDIAVISAMDADHLDIYGDLAALEAAFLAFAGQIKAGGQLLLKYGLKRGSDFRNEKKSTYSLDDSNADHYARSIVPWQGGYRFDVVLQGKVVADVHLAVGGIHNVENTVAAMAVAHCMEVPVDKIKAAVAAFQGVRRRFEYIIPSGADAEGLVMIDDYAHHPEELSSLIRSGRGLFPGKTCTIVFQPHLFSRTRDLAAEFGAALDLADEVILLPIYPAREQPLPGVTSELVLQHMQNQSRQVMDKQQLLEWLTSADHQERLLLFAGAGDIDALVQPVKQLLTKKHQAEQLRQ
jgi:UDP-N-acetylmuramate--alanine ligase